MENNLGQLNNSPAEDDPIEYYLGLTPCQDCKRFAVSQTYINNQTNRQRRVCNGCFVMAWRSNIILKEEGTIEAGKVLLD